MTHLARRRLLIVDDEKPVCELLQDRLEGMGYDCVVAHDGRSALALLALSTGKSPVDGVLLDVQMPVMDGLATLLEIRHHYPTLPVLMMSAGANETLVRQAVGAAMSDFIAKPFEMEDFAMKCGRLFPLAVS